MATNYQSAKNASGQTFNFSLPNDNGRADAASSRPVVLSNEDKALLETIANRYSSNVVTLISSSTSQGQGAAVSIYGGTYPRNVEAVLTAASVASATVKVYGGNTSDARSLLLTFSLSTNTGLDYALSSIENPNPFLMGYVVSLSGTGASINLTSGF